MSCAFLRRMKRACVPGMMAAFCFMAWVCGCTCADSEDWETHQRALIGGIPATDAAFDAVVALVAVVDDTPFVFCSGTLISPDTVLTAAHCMTGDETFDVPELLRRGMVSIVSANDVAAADAAYNGIAEIYVHPHYVVGERHDDLARIRLSVPADAEPWRISEKTMAAHDDVLMAGYGNDENGDSGVRRMAEGSVDIACEKSIGQCETSVDGKRLFVPNHAFLHLFHGQGACFGDSGGPVYILDEDGFPAIVGVHARVDGSCQLYSLSTAVQPYLGWINGQEEPEESASCATALRQRTRFGGWLGYLLAGIAFLLLKRHQKGRRGVSDAFADDSPRPRRVSPLRR